MPRYEVVELRMSEVVYLIDAENADAAYSLNGDIVNERESDSWGYDVQSVHQVADDEENL